MPLRVTPDMAVDLYPDLPVLQDSQLQDALDWADEQFERANLPLPEPDTRQDRAYIRAVSLYAYARMPSAQNLLRVLQGETLTKLKDGDTELNFSFVSAAETTAAALELEGLAWQELSRAMGTAGTYAGFAGVAR